MPLTPAERRRLVEVFGDGASEAAAEQTSDDLPDPVDRDERTEEWWQAQRPPHHGG